PPICAPREPVSCRRMTLVLVGVLTAPGIRAIAPSSMAPGSGTTLPKGPQVEDKLSNLALSSPDAHVEPGHDTSFEKPPFVAPLPRFSLTRKLPSVGSCRTWSGRPSPLTSTKSIRVVLIPQSADPLMEDDALSFFVSPLPFDSLMTC